MWNDNETAIDYLGFDDLVGELAELVRQSRLLPLTVGVFGDWGSGKSSLMGMTRHELGKDERVVTVPFSPWQHEDYDDVKTALILAVMSALEGKRSILQKLDDSKKAAVAALFSRLRQRVNLLRAVSWGIRGVSAAVLAAHGDVGAAAVLGTTNVAAAIRSVTPEKIAATTAGAVEAAAADIEEAEPVEQSVSRFRREFEQLLAELDITALVVFIDDLDRCLPETVVDTLEAVRLFLAVPKTAFVIGADERIVRHAIGRRYPELPSQGTDAVRGLDIGRDYLEKMIQIPIRIPAMTAAETETYLNLLGAELYLDDADLKKAIGAARADRGKKLSMPFNHGVAQAALATLKPEFANHIALIARIAPILAAGHSGNPRQAKRFLNTLVQRKRLAGRRGITLKADALAKLMLLEYFYLTQFKELFRWQSEASPARAPQLATLERVARAPVGKSQTREDTETGTELRRWLDEPALRRWLEMDPPLAGEDLEPYFHFSRDRLSATAPPTRRLPPELQVLIAGLRSESDTERDVAQAKFGELGESEASQVYEELAAVFVRDPRASDNKLGPLLNSLASRRRHLVSAFADALTNANPAAVQPALALQIRGSFKPVPSELVRVLERWQSEGPPPLAKAAKDALAAKK